MSWPAPYLFSVGQPSVLYYATAIFDSFDSTSLVNYATVTLGAFKVLATLGAVIFVSTV